LSQEYFVPGNHKTLTLRATSDRAVYAVAALLSLGSIVNNTKWAIAVRDWGEVAMTTYLHCWSEVDPIAALSLCKKWPRNPFYLSDAQVLKQLSQQGEYEESLDIPRSLRAMMTTPPIPKTRICSVGPPLPFGIWSAKMSDALRPLQMILLLAWLLEWNIRHNASLIRSCQNLSALVVS
jgi:hypothetical protein